MNGWKRVVIGSAIALGTLGFPAAVAVYAQQQVTKSEVETLKEQAKAAEATREEVVVLVTKFDMFVVQYEKDQGRNQEK